MHTFCLLAPRAAASAVRFFFPRFLDSKSVRVTGNPRHCWNTTPTTSAALARCIPGVPRSTFFLKRFWLCKIRTSTRERRMTFCDLTSAGARAALTARFTPITVLNLLREDRTISAKIQKTRQNTRDRAPTCAHSWTVRREELNSITGTWQTLIIYFCADGHGNRRVRRLDYNLPAKSTSISLTTRIFRSLLTVCEPVTCELPPASSFQLLTPSFLFSPPNSIRVPKRKPPRSIPLTSRTSR
jgi:hypothetical protein